jgi:hypothetical protein
MTALSKGPGTFCSVSLRTTSRSAGESRCGLGDEGVGVDDGPEIEAAG